MAVNRIWFANIPALGIDNKDRAQIAIGYGGFIPIGFIPIMDIWKAQSSVSNTWLGQSSPVDNYKSQSAVSNVWKKQEDITEKEISNTWVKQT